MTSYVTGYIRCDPVTVEVGLDCAIMEVPVVDLKDLVNGKDIVRTSKEIHEACLKYGFFYVVNSGISEDLQAKVFDATRQFFDLPLEKKQKIKKGDGFRGYFNLSDECTYLTGQPEWKEGVYYFRDYKSTKPEGTAEATFSGENPWPDKEDAPEFKTTITEYFKKATNLGYQLMRAVALNLGK